MYKVIAIEEDFDFLRYTGKTWPTSSNVFLIKDRDGLIIIDTGLNRPEVFEGLSRCIQKDGLKISDIHTILLTHGHTDHIAGVNAFKGFCKPHILLPEGSIPEAVDSKEQEKAILPQQVKDIAPGLKDYGILEEFYRSCGEWRLIREDLLPIRDGDEISLGKYRFQAIHTPGHDIGHMVFYESRLKWLLSTDLLRASIPGNALPWYSSTGGGVSAYLESLDRLKDLDVGRGFPSHGALEGPFEECHIKTRDIIVNRENKIIEALKKGPMTCEDLDTLLYNPLALIYCPWFSSTTEAHLRKLQQDGTVIRDDILFRWRDY